MKRLITSLPPVCSSWRIKLASLALICTAALFCSYAPHDRAVAASLDDNRIIITPFSGTETFAGFADPQPGTLKFVDGKTILKGFVLYFRDTMDDPRLSGDVTVVLNYVYDGPPIFGKGPLWGTMHVTNANGGWNARFTGYNYGDGRVAVNAHGFGEGWYEGMHAKWEYRSFDFGLNATATGEITEH